MIPTKVLADQLATLLATDSGSIAHATNAVKVGLITAPFVPANGLVVADLTISAVTGLTPLSGVAGNQVESIDPVTAERFVEIKAPAGGFRWETPGGFTGPVTVYGFALLDSTAAVLYGTQAVQDPVVLTAPNQAITAPPLGFRIDPAKIR